MNESQFLAKWEAEKPLYEAWGEFVVTTIESELEKLGRNLSVFLKIPATYRLKENKSLVDKAFYRPEKNYSDPYLEIEDKVGARFVVLLIADIEEISSVVEKTQSWDFDRCKHFDIDKEENPLLFTYQSVHYILRPRNEVNLEGVTIPVDTPCELQIRTLLQHAHSELTHDATYKPKRIISPKVQRIVAKSMALIETTDDFFSQVTKDLNHGPLEEYGVLNRLDGLYESTTGLKSFSSKSAHVIWDTFETIIDENLVDAIQSFLSKPELHGLGERIVKKFPENFMYQQSTVLFVYWMLYEKRMRLLRDWPLDRAYLDMLAADLGVSTLDD